MKRERLTWSDSRDKLNNKEAFTILKLELEFTKVTCEKVVWLSIFILQKARTRKWKKKWFGKKSGFGMRDTIHVKWVCPSTK